MKKYPKRRNGDEFYPKTFRDFLKDELGNERYARNKRGSEMYPKRREKIFARDKRGLEYYATDAEGDEMYPIVRNQSKFIINASTQRVKIARFKNGTQRYPSDDKGNEYYLRDEGTPFLLRTSKGNTYLAKNRRGIVMIPWNCFNQFSNGNVPYAPFVDAGGNVVYVNHENVSRVANAFLRCLCEMIVICPTVAVTGLLCAQ